MQCREAEELVGTTFPMQSGGTDQVANAPNVIRLPHLKSMGAEPLAHGGLPPLGAAHSQRQLRVEGERGVRARLPGAQTDRRDHSENNGKGREVVLIPTHPADLGAVHGRRPDSPRQLEEIKALAHSESLKRGALHQCSTS